MSQESSGGPVVVPGRVRGFEKPLSRNQISSWVGNGVATGGFYVLCAVAACDKTYVVLGVHAIFVLCGASCWIFLETHPPTEESCFSKMLPDIDRWTKTRYSREHKKVVVGLDHYCTWLNVAICRSNYVPFYLVALFGTGQYALHVVVTIILITSCTVGPGLVAFSVLWLAFGACIFFLYASLASFHTFLCYHRIGTYDWILQQRQAEITSQQEQQQQQVVSRADDDDATEVCTCLKPMFASSREQKQATQKASATPPNP